LQNWLARNLTEFSLLGKIIIVILLYVLCIFLAISQISFFPEFPQSAFAILFVPLIIGALLFEVKAGITLSFITTLSIFFLAYLLGKRISMSPTEYFITLFFPCLVAILGGTFIGSFNAYKRSREETIRESEEKYRKLIEVANEAREGLLVLQNRAGKEATIQYANNALAEMLGYHPQQLLGKTFREIIDPEISSQLIDQYRRRLKGEKIPGYQEIKMIGREGRKIIAETASGVTTYQGKPALIAYYRDITIRKKMEDKLQELTIKDDLTGLYNSRFFTRQLNEEIERNKRYGEIFSLLYVDIDNFKKYNDSRGHPAGDKLLQKIADLIRSKLRTLDYAFRYGGEEFTVLLPSTNLKGAEQVAERIRKRISQHSQDTNGVTVSIGVAQYAPGKNLVNLADQALYQAKQLGKDKICLAQQR